MDKRTDYIERERCPKCGKMLPLTVVRGNGEVFLEVYCKHCKRASIIRIRVEC